MKQQCRQDPQTGYDKRPGNSLEQSRRRRIVNLRVQRQQRPAIEKKQRQAQKEKHPLEIPLAAVAQNHHHPEQHQQRAGGVTDQPNVEKRGHPFQCSRYYPPSLSTAISKCKKILALSKLLITLNL